MSREWLFLSVCAVLLHDVARAQQTGPAPTAFESFATDPGAELLAVEEIGSIRSSDGILIVTAMAVASRSRPGERMSGIRVRLEDNSGFDEGYVAADELNAVLADLDALDSDRSLLADGLGAPYSVQGTEACWMPDPVTRRLCPGYGIGPAWEGLTISIYGGKGFRFPAYTPGDLAALLRSASKVLEPAVDDGRRADPQ